VSVTLLVCLHVQVLGDLAAAFLDAVEAEEQARAECDTAEPESVEWLRLKDACAFHAERRYKIGCLIAQTLGLPATSTRGELLDAIDHLRQVGEKLERRIGKQAPHPARLAERTLTRAELERPFDAAAIRRQNEQRRAIYRDDEELGE